MRCDNCGKQIGDTDQYAHIGREDGPRPHDALSAEWNLCVGCYMAGVPMDLATPEGGGE